MTRVNVDTMCYRTAADRFGMANSQVVGAVQRLAGALSGCGAMAGNDTGGTEWAGKYDPAASELLRAGAQMGEALGKAGSLLAASGSNHEHADAASRTSGGGYNAPIPTPPDAHYQSIGAPSPPSAAGGTGDVPGWWHWIASHVGGLLWPDADTGKLRSAGDAWASAGSSITSASSDVSAASSEISGQRSPEVPAAEAACSKLAQQLSQLGSAYNSIGHACHEYADAVDKHHQMVMDELKSFIEWTVGIEAGSAVVGFFTFGGGEVAGQAIEGAEVANAASKVVKILTSLLEIARLGAAKLGDLIETASAAVDGVKGLLSARVVRALEAVAPSLGKTADGAAQAIETPKEGMTVWRVYGEAQDGMGGLERGSRPFGESWTPKDPATSRDFRWDAGLPDENPARFIAKGVLHDPEAVFEIRNALELDGNPGGWPEYLIHNAEEAIELRSVAGVNEPWTTLPGEWIPK